MKATQAALVVLAILLAGSTMVNFMVLQKLRESKPEPRAASPLTAAHSSPSPANPVPAADSTAKLDQILREVAKLRSEMTAMRGGSGTPVPAVPDPVAGPALDPEVAKALAEQAAFNVFWEDVYQIFDARDRIEPAAFARSVIGTTAEYLKLSGETRARFEEAAAVSANELKAARAELEEGRKTLPPKDKANPGPRDQASQALDARWKERQKAAGERVRALLNPSMPGHKDFGDRTDKWLRELAGV